MFIYAILLLLPALALAQDPHAQMENKLFSALDNNNNNEINKNEFESYIWTYDTDKDMGVSQQEFGSGLAKLDPALVGHETLLFGLFDRNMDGKIDKSDMDIVFGLADSDKNNLISKPEFHTIFEIVMTHVG